MDKDQSLEGTSWTNRTVSYLNATLPIDIGKAILFLPEQGTSKTATTESIRPPVGQVPSISGEEAKEFYEEVLSMPQEERTCHKSNTNTDTSKTRKRKSRYKARSRQKSERTYTVGQVFRFAQDGDLDLLRQASSSGQFPVNITDNFNWTLLMSASYAGHTDAVEYLMSIGAKWRTIVDHSGQNAVDLALSAGYDHIAKVIQEYGVSDSSDIQGRPSSSIAKHSTPDSYRDIADQSPEAKRICDICQVSVSHDTSSDPHTHNTSTLHQFNCHHHPSPNTVYGIPQSNRGYQMLLKRGWDPEAGLGSEQQGQQFPVKTILKRDRLGLGVKRKESSKARVTHFEPGDKAAIRTASEACFKNGGHSKKKDIVKTAKRDKQWELRMRRYLNSDHDQIY